MDNPPVRLASLQDLKRWPEISQDTNARGCTIWIQSTRAVKQCDISSARFENEINLIKQCCHPNIIKITETWTDGESRFYSMPRYWTDLLTAVNSRIPNLVIARSEFKQIIAAISYLHTNNIVHLDIKLENILVGPTLVLADFEFAKSCKPGQLLTEFVGSPHYSAPELVNRAPYDPYRSDIYSAGVVLYALGHGFLPFGGSTYRELFRRIRSGKYQINPKLDERYLYLLRWMMHANPNLRADIKDVEKHDWLNRTV